MPVFVDWNSLLFGSSPAPIQKVVPAFEPDASHAKIPASRNAPVERVTPQGAARESVVTTKTALSGDEIPRSMSIEPEPVTTPPTTAALRLALNPDDATGRLLLAVIFLTTIVLWLWFGRRKSSKKLQQLTANPEKNAIEEIKRALAHETRALERQFNRELSEQLSLVKENFQKSLEGQSDFVEEHVRKTLSRQVEPLEVRIARDHEALENIHQALSDRMDIFEGYVKTIDAKHLDQEANCIAQIKLGQRIDAVEESFKSIDVRTRASSQRIEAIDDSVRACDGRTKVLGQRIDSVEANLNNSDGQLTLLSHDLSRGSSVIEKLQKQVKMLPESEIFKGLSRSWEAKLNKLETELEETRKALEERLSVPPPSLTLSHIESVDIEPSALPDTRYLTQSPDEMLVSPTFSLRSQSQASNYSRRSSNSSARFSTPVTPDRRRFCPPAGYHETTFASRQKTLAYRGGSHQSPISRGKYTDLRVEVEMPVMKIVSP